MAQASTFALVSTDYRLDRERHADLSGEGPRLHGAKPLA